MSKYDTLRRTLTGSAITTPLALLFNRYILGNKSGRSAATAGLIGAMLGGTGGYLYDKYGYSKDDTNVDTTSSILSELNEEILRDPEQLRAYKDRLIKSGLSEEEASGVVNAGLDLLKKSDDFKADPEKVYKTFAFDGALDKLNNKQKAFYDSLVERVKPRLGRDGKGELNHFLGMEGMTQQGWDELLSMAGHTMSKDSLRARVMYHNSLQQAYNSLRGSKFGDAYKNPVALDYIALKAVPEALRKHIPVSHRLTAMSRAIQTRGHSYDLDRDIFYNPRQAANDIKRMMKHNAYSDVMSSVPIAFAGPWWRAGMVAGKQILVNKDGAGNIFKYKKPRPWGHRYKNSVLDDWNWKTAVLERAWDPTKMEVYDFMLPTANSKARAEHYARMTTAIADAVADARSLGKVFIGGSALKPHLRSGKFLTSKLGRKALTGAVFDNAISRGSDLAYGDLSLHKPTAVPKTYVDSEGNPLGPFADIYLNSALGGFGNIPTGLQDLAYDYEKSFGD